MEQFLAQLEEEYREFDKLVEACAKATDEYAIVVKPSWFAINDDNTLDVNYDFVYDVTEKYFIMTDGNRLCCLPIEVVSWVIGEFYN